MKEGREERVGTWERGGKKGRGHERGEGTNEGTWEREVKRGRGHGTEGKWGDDVEREMRGSEEPGGKGGR